MNRIELPSEDARIEIVVEDRENMTVTKLYFVTS